eukprot:scaffold111529_cov58-Phaeocystis_antarctica.AAC.1
MPSTSGRSMSSGAATPAALSPRRRRLPSAVGSTKGAFAMSPGATLETATCRSLLDICVGGAPTSIASSSAPPTASMPATRAPATSLPAAPPLVASTIAPSVSTASPAFSPDISPPSPKRPPPLRPLRNSLTESSVTGGRLGGGVLGGGEGGGGGGDGWIVSSLMSPSRYWIDSRLMYVVDVSEKLVGVGVG